MKLDLRALRAMSLFAAKDRGRPVLCNVAVYEEAGYLVATDSYGLGLLGRGRPASLVKKGRTLGQPDFLISRPMIKRLSTLFHRDAEIEVSKTSKRLTIVGDFPLGGRHDETGKAELGMDYRDVEYPLWGKLLEEAPNPKLAAGTFNARYLARFSQVMGALGNDQSPIRIHGGGGALMPVHFSAHTRTYGTMVSLLMPIRNEPDLGWGDE